MHFARTAAASAAASASLSVRHLIPADTVGVQESSHDAFDRRAQLLTKWLIIWVRIVDSMASAELDAVFAALTHPIRRAMIERLAASDATVGELAAPHDVSAPAITKHVRVLEDAGLLLVEREGRTRRCRLAAAPLGDAVGWITKLRLYWQDRFDALDQLLTPHDEQEETK